MRRAHSGDRGAQRAGGDRGGIGRRDVRTHPRTRGARDRAGAAGRRAGERSGLEASATGWGVLGDPLLEAVCAGRRLSTLLQTGIGLARPLVAIGAPVGAYYPEVARRLGSPLSIPEHASVCNAVGAVAGVVSQTVDILVNQPTFKVFRVHDPAGSRDYPEPEPALEHAHRVSRALALEAARRAGAADPHVDTEVSEKRAQVGPGTDYLAEALVRSTAVGRPLVSH